MAQLGQWFNADGLLVKFGEYYKNPTNFVNRVRQLNTLGGRTQLEIDVDLTQIPTGTVSFTTNRDNDGTLDGFNIGDVSIPPNSSILSATFVVDVAAAGGTNFAVGLFQVDGTIIDFDNIMTTTDGTTANLTPTGARVYGTGDLVSTSAGTVGTGASTSYVGITTSGTFTAGTGRLIIEYLAQNIANVNVA